MIDINGQERILLAQLAQRLRQARLQRNESQAVFAARLGLSRQSYSKMENGAATIPIGTWLAASALLGRLTTWEGVLVEQENLFERFEQQKNVRKRAGKREIDRNS